MRRAFPPVDGRTTSAVTSAAAANDDALALAGDDRDAVEVVDDKADIEDACVAQQGALEAAAPKIDRGGLLRSPVPVQRLARSHGAGRLDATVRRGAAADRPASTIGAMSA
jgi:hypothetical protein